jgi:hypothetical protein
MSSNLVLLGVECIAHPALSQPIATYVAEAALGDRGGSAERDPLDRLKIAFACWPNFQEKYLQICQNHTMGFKNDCI